jgi:flagellar biosynthesis protein FliQ
MLMWVCVPAIILSLLMMIMVAIIMAVWMIMRDTLMNVGVLVLFAHEQKQGHNK